MAYHTDFDPYYCYDGTTTLINRFGIRDRDELLRREATIVTVNIARFKASRIPGSFDRDHLCAIHRALFGDVYDWAGKFRTVDIAIGIPFCTALYIGTNLDALLGDLREENYLKGLDKDVFARRLAFYFGELNAIHPFREGNGRTQRLFFEYLAESAGYGIDFIGVGRERMADACEAAMYGDYMHLESIMYDLLS